MKNLKVIFSIAWIVTGLAVNAQTTKPANTIQKIEAYYFHFSARCMTCKTVESEAKKNIETLYPEMVKLGTIRFQSINLDDTSGKVLADKLDISGQTLILVKGDTKIDITNEGFLYAVNQPEKFKLAIKEKVDGLLK